jgi:hypothetical protein
LQQAVTSRLLAIPLAGCSPRIRIERCNNMGSEINLAGCETPLAVPAGTFAEHGHVMAGAVQGSGGDSAMTPVPRMTTS